MKYLLPFLEGIILLIMVSCEDKDLVQSPASDIWTRYSNSSLSTHTVTSIKEDSNHALWFGTEGGGAVVYSNGSWKTYTTQNAIMPDNYVYAIEEDKSGTIWLGTYYGIAWYDGSEWSGLYTPSPVRSIESIHNGSVYFGMAAGGYVEYRKSDQAFYLWHFNDSTLNQINQIFEDKDQNIWFCTANGLVKSGSTSTTLYRKTDGLSKNNVMSIFQDSRGIIWLGFWGGEYVQTYDGSVFRSILLNQGYPENYILSIGEDMLGNIWFGTIATGAIKYDGGIMEPFSQENGMVDNSIVVVYRDHLNQMWFGGLENGVCTLNQSINF